MGVALLGPFDDIRRWMKVSDGLANEERAILEAWL